MEQFLYICVLLRRCFEVQRLETVREAFALVLGNLPRILAVNFGRHNYEIDLLAFILLNVDQQALQIIKRLLIFKLLKPYLDLGIDINTSDVEGQDYAVAGFYIAVGQFAETVSARHIPNLQTDYLVVVFQLLLIILHPYCFLF